jgi:hypothetical protein
MEVSDTVWELVNFRKPTEGFLATADAEGNCDAACFSSLQLSDRETMTMLIGENRTLSNLRVNPKAAFVTARGEDMESVEGCRLYLEVESIVEEGPVIEKGKMMLEETAGKEAAETVAAFVTFDVTGVRPLIDTGQEI